MEKTTLKELQDLIVKFRDERDWEKFHLPKDLAIGLSIEASEILEHFRFKTNEEINEYVNNEDNKKKLGYEMADTLIFLLALAKVTNVDLVKSCHEKTEINKKKYPIEKCKGRPNKYTEYTNDNPN
jgi:dCTP diphosphatase